MWSVSKEIYMYQQNYHSMQTWIILEQKDNNNSEMISANCAVGHTLGSIMFGTFESVWCKTALAEVGLSLPWWCLAPVLLF